MILAPAPERLSAGASSDSVGRRSCVASAAGPAWTSTRSRRWSRAVGRPARSRTLDRRGRPQPGDRRAAGAVAVDALLVDGVARRPLPTCASSGRLVALRLLGARPTAGGPCPAPARPSRPSSRVASPTTFGPPAHGGRRPRGCGAVTAWTSTLSLPSACSPSTVTVSPTNGASGLSSPHHHGGPTSSTSTAAVDGQRVLGLAVLVGPGPDRPVSSTGSRPGGPPCRPGRAGPPSGRCPGSCPSGPCRASRSRRGRGSTSGSSFGGRDRAGGCGHRESRCPAPAPRRHGRDRGDSDGELRATGRGGMGGVCAWPGAGQCPRGPRARVVPGRTAIPSAPPGRRSARRPADRPR